MRLATQSKAQTSMILAVTGTQREDDNHHDHEHHHPQQVARNPIGTNETSLLTYRKSYLENIVQL